MFLMLLMLLWPCVVMNLWLLWSLLRAQLRYLHLCKAPLMCSPSLCSSYGLAQMVLTMYYKSVEYIILSRKVWVGLPYTVVRSVVRSRWYKGVKNNMDPWVRGPASSVWYQHNWALTTEPMVPYVVNMILISIIFSTELMTSWYLSWSKLVHLSMPKLNVLKFSCGREGVQVEKCFVSLYDS